MERKNKNLWYSTFLTWSKQEKKGKLKYQTKTTQKKAGRKVKCYLVLLFLSKSVNPFMQMF